MNTELKSKLSYNGVIIRLSLITLISGVAIAFLGELMLPVTAAFYTALLIYEKKEKTKKLFSIFVPIVIVGINVALGNYLPVIALEAILVALAIFFTYTRGMQKSEAVFSVTIIIAAMTLLSLILVSMVEMGSFSFDAVAEYYSNLYDSAKSAFVSSITDASLKMGAETLVTASEISELFDSVIDVLPSVLFLAAFFLAGATFKAFSLIIFRFSENTDYILKWRFMTSNVFAYAAAVFIIVSSFFAGSTDIFAIAMYNISNIFIFIYAYLGFNYTHALLSAKRSGAFSFLLLIVLICVFSSLALQILAVLGVFFTISHNKFIRQSGNNNNQGGGSTHL